MLERLLSARKRVLLVGPPGCGKTARVHQAAVKCGLELITMRASLSERVDFGGALVPDFERGITRALPLDLLHTLRTTDKPTLLFLDDLGQAPIDVQSALMRLYDSDGLSPSVTIWGATNRPGDKAGVSALCEPLRSRFDVSFAIATPEIEDKPDGGVLLSTWAEECEAWCQWAMDAQLAPEIIAWHRFTTGKSLYAWKPHADPAVRMPDYRAWKTASDLMQAGMREEVFLAAAVGKGFAREFASFMDVSQKLPSPDDVRKRPDKAPVPDEPSALYLVVSSLAASATAADSKPFCVYMDRLPRIFAALLGRDLYRRLKSAFTDDNLAWAKWFQKNQTLFVS